ncbi:Hypothetical protein, predicted transmembrane protein [Mycoplasma mycoides subsp. capri PG3]|nr:Hypothetical protein, predicted transmembrane protein [Mycoplasma mycoides subsp. capri PG3]
MSKFYKRYWLKSSFKKIELFKILVKTTNVKKRFVKFYLPILEIQILITDLAYFLIIKLDNIIVKIIKIIKIFLKRILWYLLIITWFLIRLI